MNNSLLKKSTTHFTEFADFIPQIIFRYIKMPCKTEKAKKTVRSPVDHFPGQGNFIRFQHASALPAKG